MQTLTEQDLKDIEDKMVATGFAYRSEVMPLLMALLEAIGSDLLMTRSMQESFIAHCKSYKGNPETWYWWGKYYAIIPHQLKDFWQALQALKASRELVDNYKLPPEQEDAKTD